MVKRIYNEVKDFIKFHNVNFGLAIISSTYTISSSINNMNLEMLMGAVITVGSLEHMRLKERFKSQIEKLIQNTTLNKKSKTCEYLTEHYLKGFKNKEIINLYENA